MSSVANLTLFPCKLLISMQLHLWKFIFLCRGLVFPSVIFKQGLISSIDISKENEFADKDIYNISNTSVKLSECSKFSIDITVWKMTLSTCTWSEAFFHGVKDDSRELTSNNSVFLSWEILLKYFPKANRLSWWEKFSFSFPFAFWCKSSSRSIIELLPFYIFGRKPSKGVYWSNI